MRRSQAAFFAAAALALVLGAANAAAQRVSQGTTFSVPFSLPSGPKATRFYGTALSGLSVNTAVGAANRLWVSPVYLGGGSQLLKTLSFDIGTGNASAWNARMCVYADTGGGLPGALAADSGTVAISSGSVVGVQTATLAAGGTVLPGPAWYWVGWMADSASESVFAANNATSYLASYTIAGFASASNLFTNSPTLGYWQAQTFGACPGSFGGSPSDGNGQVMPYIALGF